MIRIGRPINGITINGLEYLLDGNGREMRFADEAAASDFLREKGYSDDEIENGGIVFLEASDEAEDKFYIDKESGAVRWIYYNPDSDAGGQYVESEFGYDLIHEAAEADDLFDRIGSCCKQYLIDKDSDDFPDYDELFKTIPADFEGCTEKTKTALIALASPEQTDKVLFTTDNIEVDRELFIEGDYINAYLGCYFDVDEKFGTQTFGTASYLNVYANYTPDTDKLEVGYTLIDADGSDHDFIAIELTDSERTAILEKLREAGLDECVAEMQSEQGEDGGMTMT